LLLDAKHLFVAAHLGWTANEPPFCDNATLSAKSATDNPDRVRRRPGPASLARPGGNATGVNFFFGELTAKRLGLPHERAPKAAQIAVLVNQPILRPPGRRCGI
jgi:hypothetical protein